MAKKSQVPPEPKMTSLPMGNTDSPLVIDLPDGQKLVVGNLAAGSVIEVATWRGTGRPDSRTSRLMLGMSSGQEKAADAAPAESKKAAPSFVGVILGTARTIVGKISAYLSSAKKKSSEKKSTAPLIEKVTPAARTTDAAEVDDWLNSILEKSAKKPAAKAESAKSEPTTKPVKKAPVKKTAAKKSPKKTTARRAR